MKKFLCVVLGLALFGYRKVEASNLSRLHYYCTVADEKHYQMVINLIGSIHAVDFENLQEIAVFDLGFTEKQKNTLSRMKKVRVCQVEKTHPDILKYFKSSDGGRMIRGWFAWKPVIIKQAADMYPYFLYMDAGTTVLRPLNDLFDYIQENGSFLMSIAPHTIEERITKPVIEKVVLQQSKEDQELVMSPNTFMIDAGLQGFSSAVYQNYIMPVYNLTYDLSLFADDGSAKLGFGAGRHDQTIFSMYVYLAKLKTLAQGWMNLKVNGRDIPFHVHWDPVCVEAGTSIYRSRGGIGFRENWIGKIKYN